MSVTLPPGVGGSGPATDRRVVTEWVTERSQIN